MSDLITSEDLANRLKVKVTTIKRWTRAGAIPCIKISGKVIRYDYAEVLASLRSRGSINNTIPPATADIEGQAGVNHHNEQQSRAFP